VLLVTIDTLRADALGSYGGRVATPNLDRLAAGGARFTFAHAHAVTTLPSHASLFTGLYPHQHGVRDNSGYRLGIGTPTLAALLEATGWSTGAFVGAFPVDSRFGLDTGFEIYDDDFGLSAAPTDFSFAERRADAVVTAARAWIGAQRGRWFAWVHLFDPHAAYDPPEPFASRYPGEPYLGEVAYTDSALAPLLDDVRRMTDRPTLVVVTSDHGEALGDHGELTHGLFAYEATLHVPLIVTPLDGQPRRPATIGAPVRHVDVLPTILDALGQPAPDGLAGRTLLDWEGNLTGNEDTEASYFEALSASLNRGWAPLTGVLVGREKYVDLPIPELYDLARDAAERHNRADVDATRRRVLETRLAGLGRTAAGERRRESPEAEARLRALGYVAGTAAVKERYTEADDPKRLVEIDRAIHQAIDHFQRGRPAEAMALYRSVLERRGHTGIAYRHLAYVQWTLGERREAVATLEAAMRTGASTLTLRAQLGNYLVEAGQPDVAVELLEPVANDADPDLDALNALGIAEARLGRTQKALGAFERILAVDPTNVMALENVGAVHLQAGDLGAARIAFERVLAVNPRSSAAYTGLGAVAAKAGRPEEAIAHWTRAVELDAANFDALFNLGTELANAGRLTEARPYLERFVRTAPPAAYGDDIRKLRALLEKR